MKRRLTFLITAGPTVEDLDPVRFISNRASGRLGFEAARAALAAGHRAILIHGPVGETLVAALERSCRAPRWGVRGAPGGRPHLTRVPVRSAAQMRRAVLKALPGTDVVVMTAAVADFTPARRAARKLKTSRRGLVLRLKPTGDILAELGALKRARRPDLVLIGFALETGAGRTPAARARRRLREAQRKLAAKHLDAIVLDTPAAMGAAQAVFQVLRAKAGRVERLAASKRALARRLVKLGAKCAAEEGNRQ